MLVTAVAHQLHLNFAIASFVYLIVVIVQSLAGDFLSAVVVSFGAVASLDFFFEDPLYTFMITRGIDAVA